MRNIIYNMDRTIQFEGIKCQHCGGWHATSEHESYERQAREQRMKEMHKRPPGDYRFETLAYKPKSEKIEPWMETVVEKAKELGDDLADTDWLMHLAPLDKWYLQSKREDVTMPSGLEMAFASSLQESQLLQMKKSTASR